MAIFCGVGALAATVVMYAQDVDAHHLASDLHAAGVSTAATIEDVSTSSRGSTTIVHVALVTPSGPEDVTLAGAFGPSGDRSYRGIDVGETIPVLYLASSPGRAMARADVDQQWAALPDESFPTLVGGLAAVLILGGAWVLFRQRWPADRNAGPARQGKGPRR
jgi:hypothetical protein